MRETVFACLRPVIRFLAPLIVEMLAEYKRGKQAELISLVRKHQPPKDAA